jgi:luciferase family oxidoreductase group 1
MELGVLDWCTIETGRSVAYPLASSIELARRLETAGYSRYWLSEHHEKNAAHSCPEVLLGVLAGATKTIRVGTAGVLIRHHNCYRIAETFEALHSLFEGRVECGLSCSNSPTAAHMGLEETSDEQIDGKIKRICALLREGARLKGNVARPPLPTWIVGGAASMRRAAENGASYALDMLFQEVSLSKARDLVSEYYSTFQSGNGSLRPECVIAVAGVCGDTDDESEQAITAYLRRGANSRVKPLMRGEKRRCADWLVDLASDIGVGGAVVLELSQGFYARLQSYVNLIQAVSDVSRAAAS